MKPNLEDIEYISGRILFENCPCVTTSDTNAFVKLIDIYKPKVIFISGRCFYFDRSGELRDSQTGEAKNYSEFRFVHQNTCYAAAGWNYRNPSDFMQGDANGFETGDEYYDAKAKGFSSNKDYQDFLTKGYRSKEDFDKSVELGFTDCLDKYNQLAGSDTVKIKSAHFSRESDVFYYALKKGYADFQGIVDVAKSGFLTIGDYREGHSNGFCCGSEYEEAKSLGIFDKSEYDFYSELKQIKDENGFETIQEAHLYKIILTTDDREYVEIRNLWEMLQKESVENAWYDRRLESISSLEEYLTKNTIIGSIGACALSGEKFQRIDSKPISASTVIIDASNVSWGDGSKEAGDKPRLSNLVLVMKNLADRGFEDIVAVADASLRHQIDNQSEYERMKKRGKIKEAPARTDADYFIIEIVKKKNALVITNDAFEDWKKQDSWTSQNIDRFGCKFFWLTHICLLYKALTI